MPLVQQGSTLNTATGDTANQTWNHYNAELANGDLALYIANGSGVASLRITNAAGELIRELNTPGFNTIREMVALPDGGLLLLGFQSAPVAGLAAQVLNADGTFRTAAPVLITSNLTLLNGGSNVVAELLPNGEVYVAWTSNKDEFQTVNPLITINSGPGTGQTLGSAPMSFDVAGARINPNLLGGVGNGTLLNAGIEIGPDYTVADRRAGPQYVTDIDLLANGNVLVTSFGARFTVTGATVMMANTIEVNPTTGAIVVPQRAISDNPVIGTQSFQGTESQFAKSVTLGPDDIGSFAALQVAGNPSFTTSGRMLVTDPGTGLAPGGIGSFVNIGLNFSMGSPIAGFDPLPHGANDFVAAYTFYNSASLNYDIKIRHYNASGVVQSEIDVANGPTNEWVLGFSKGEDNSYLITYRVQSGERITKRYVVTEPSGVQSLTGGFAGETINLGAANDWGAGGGGDDTLRGFDGDDHLFGEQGSDRLEGGIGNDDLLGGTENDSLVGGAGADRLDGGAGFDAALFSAGAARVIVNLFTGQGFEGEAAGDRYVSVENVIATAFNDIVVGAAAANFLDGVNGADTLYGNAGNDTLLGGEGADLMFGEADNDLAFGWTGNDVLWGGTGNDTLFGEQDNDTLLGEAGNDILLGDLGADVLYGWVGDDVLYGWVGDDVLWGEAGNDSLLGEDGNDTFIGGLGRDTMTGGAGADRFFSANFEIAAGEVDLISDYDAADIYLFQAGAQLQYFNFNAPGYGIGAGIHVQVAGGVFILDVFGANAAQLQAQTQFF